MAELNAELKAKSIFSPSFFLWMTLSIAFFIFAGFGITYLQPMAAGIAQPLPPIVHLHGIFYFGWIVLLVMQAMLVNVNNIRLHRTVGTFGIFIGSGVILMGAAISVLFANSQVDDPVSDFNNLMYLAIVSVVGFSALFVLAIRRVRVPTDHKRLILFATIILLPPGINRLYMMSLSLVDLPLLATYLTMDALVLAILIYDWQQLGKISKASVIGALSIILPQLMHGVLADSELFTGFYVLLAELTYYR